MTTTYSKEIESPRCTHREVDEGAEAASDQDERDGQSGLETHRVEGRFEPGVVSAEQGREISLLSSDVDEPRARKE